jgi:hypothetical protein
MKEPAAWSARALASQWLGAALVLGLTRAPALSQAEGEDEPRPLGPPPGIVPDEEDHGREIVELFAEVERKLREIDVLLSDAAAGDAPLEPDIDSGLADLLKTSRKRGAEVVAGIDKILEHAGGT